MAWINTQILRNSTDITNYVTQYKRETNICSGVGVAGVTMDSSVSVSPGDIIKIYEEAALGGIYIVSTISRTTEGTKILECQDYSKRLQDYFITELHNFYGKSSRYWITQVFEWAGLSVSFSGVGDGYYQPAGIEFGLESAYDAVVRMCQQSGWYFYFDTSGTGIVGHLSDTVGGYTDTITEDIILTESLQEKDDMLRNRVIVWGGTTSTPPYNSIIAQLDTKTSWDRSGVDRRTIAYGNSYIKDYDTAYSLGKDILDEFSKTVGEKTYTVAGKRNIIPGRGVRCKSRIFNGVGRATTVGFYVSSSEGMQTMVILDQRCPRIFAYISYDGDYVYVGTKSHGVYRKLLQGTTWSDWSTGITNKNIRDLKIKNGLFVATTDTNEVYMRLIGDSSWTDITPAGWTEIIDGTPTDFSTDGYLCRGCAINEVTGEIHVGFYDTTISGSWVGGYNPHEISLAGEGGWNFTQIITDNGKDLVEALDTDFNSKNRVLTARTSVPSEIERIYQGLNRNVYSEENGMFQQTNAYAYFDPKTVTTGSSYTTSNATLVETMFTSSTIHHGYIYQNKFYVCYSSSLVEYDMATDSSTTHTFTTMGTAFFRREIYSPNGDDFYIINDNVLHKYTISTDTITQLDAQIFPYTAESTQAQYLLYENYYYILEQYNGTNKTFTMYQYDLLQADIVTSVTTPGLLDDGEPTLWDREELMTITDTGAYIVSLGLVGGGGGETTVRYTIGVINHSGTTATADGAWYTWTDTGDGNPFGSGSIVPMKVCSNDRQGNVVMSCAGYMRNNQSTWTQYHFNFFLFLPDLTTTSQKYTYTRFTPFLGGGWHPYLNDGISSAPQYTGTSFYAITMRGEFLTRVKDGTTTSSEYFIRDITGTLKTNIDGEFTSNALQMNQVADDYDNTLLTVNGSGDVEFIDKYGTLVKTLICDTNMSDSLGTRFPVPVGESTGVLIAGLANSSIYFYSISGVAMPPDITGVVAITDNFITASGDTFGVIEQFTTSGNMYVECSQSSPTIFFGGELADGVVAISETLASGDMTYTPTAWYLDGNITPKKTEVLDARSVNMVGPVYDKMVYEVGAPRTGEDYLFAVVQSGMYVRKLESSVDFWNVYDDTDTPMHRMETSNYGANPYFFFSTSGAPSKFYQQDPDETSFTEYSTGLPGSNITVIRVDDKV